MNFVERLAVHACLGLGQGVHHRPRPLSATRGGVELLHHRHHLTVSGVVMVVRVVVGMMMAVAMSVIVLMSVTMVVVMMSVVVLVRVIVIMAMLVAVIGGVPAVGVGGGLGLRGCGVVGVGLVLQCDLEVHRPDAVPGDALGGDVVGPLGGQLGEGGADVLKVDAQVDQGTEEHVAGYAAERIEVQVGWHRRR